MRCVHRWVAPTLKELKRRRDKMGPEPATQRSSFLEWNHKAEMYAFGKRLNEDLNEELLLQAFVHKSYINQEEIRQRACGIDEPVIALKHNSHLIKKGEQIIDEYVIVFIKAHLPKLPSDQLKDVFEWLIEEARLANISLHLGTKDLILSQDFPVEEATLSKTLKAVVAVVDMCSGRERANEFVRDFICTQLNQIDIADIIKVDKAMDVLKAVCKECGLGEPEPRLINEAATNTILATYEVGVYCDKKMIGRGFGEGVDIAVEVAAMDCLSQLWGIKNLKPFDFNIKLNSDSGAERADQRV